MLSFQQGESFLQFGDIVLATKEVVTIDPSTAGETSAEVGGNRAPACHTDVVGKNLVQDLVIKNTRFGYGRIVEFSELFFLVYFLLRILLGMVLNGRIEFINELTACF